MQRVDDAEMKQACVKGSKSISNNETGNHFLYINHCIHRHRFECIVTWVVMHGVEFILLKCVHSLSPNLQCFKRMWRIASIYDVYLNDISSSLQWSTGNEHDRVTTNGTSSEEYQGTYKQKKQTII